MTEPAPVVFRPRPFDYRRTWLKVILFLTPYAVLTPLLWAMGPVVAVPWTVVLVPTVVVVLLVLFRSGHAVTYRLEAEALVLRYGKLVHYRLPYGTISTVQRYNLTTRERPAFGGTWALLPGLDTTVYRTPDMGNIRLLASASAGALVLIVTERGKYGINPRDEERFMAALRQRIRWARPAWTGDEWASDPDAPEDLAAHGVVLAGEPGGPETDETGSDGR
ncbi:MAG TPA: PH domain-containing protein [Chloroflexia bacterium]|nr:PH domain-containing protein [Chloroflexia bacterium]